MDASLHDVGVEHLLWALDRRSTPNSGSAIREPMPKGPLLYRGYPQAYPPGTPPPIRALALRVLSTREEARREDESQSADGGFVGLPGSGRDLPRHARANTAGHPAYRRAGPADRQGRDRTAGRSAACRERHHLQPVPAACRHALVLAGLRFDGTLDAFGAPSSLVAALHARLRRDGLLA